jgi:hypothetical protein
VRFAKVSCFCFLVFERLGITNELRASKDKLQGFLQSGYQLSALPTASPKCNFVMGHEANDEIDRCLEAFSAAAMMCSDCTWKTAEEKPPELDKVA